MVKQKVTLSSAGSQHKGPAAAYCRPLKTAVSRVPDSIKSNFSKSQSSIDRKQHVTIEESMVLLQMRHSWTSHKCFVAQLNTFKKKEKEKKKVMAT